MVPSLTGFKPFGSVEICECLICWHTKTEGVKVSETGNTNSLVYRVRYVSWFALRVILIISALGLSYSFFTSTANAELVTATIPVSHEPVALAYDSAKGEMFVASAFSDTVSVISDA